MRSISIAKATDNAVDIACELNFYVFTIDEWKAFARTGSDRKEKHYHLLRTEITGESHPNLSELGRAQKAWDLAGQSGNGLSIISPEAFYLV